MYIITGAKVIYFIAVKEEFLDMFLAISFNCENFNENPAQR